MTLCMFTFVVVEIFFVLQVPHPVPVLRERHVRAQRHLALLVPPLPGLQEQDHLGGVQDADLQRRIRP